MGRKSYVSAGKMANMCRICLTHSTHVMYELTNELALDDDDQITRTSILEALEKVVSVKVVMNEEFPQYICPICMSMLKMTYKFVCQFEDSQNKLFKIFDKIPTHDVASSICHVKEEIDTDLNIKEDRNAPVEIIYRQNKFNLKDVIVVEEEKDDELNFSAFLKNLGQEISATFADKSQTKLDIKDLEEDAVSIYLTNNENDILPIKEIKIDDDTNSINYVLEDAEFKFALDKNIQNKFEFIEIDGPDDSFEMLTIEAPNSDDTEIHKDKENYKRKMSDMQEVIESLIIETSGNEEEKKYDKNNAVDRGRFKKIVRPGKRKKLIQEKKIEDMIIMGPINEEDKEKKQVIMDDDTFEKEIQVPCELCKKIFATKRALRAHKKRSHFPQNRQYTCEICGYRNNTRSAYVNHKIKHIGKKFSCEICNKTYYTRAVLKVHMATHINNRQHLCNVCGKGFNYANALVYHMRLHTGERSYKCEYCGDTFRMPNSLKRHLCTHTGERPYKCQFCGRGFCSRGEVQCHENIHTGYRPYHCKHCMKGFTKTHNLKLHLLSHAGPHHCEICGKSFIEMSILSMHYKISHKDLLEKDEEATYS